MPDFAEVEDNEGLTQVEPARKRKSPERFGPVTSADLVNLREIIKKQESYDDDVGLEVELERLILRAKIAEAAARKAAKAAK